MTDDQRHREEWWAQYWNRSKTACHTCRFFLADDGKSPEFGECRRSEPRGREDGLVWRGVWPTVDVNDFCGQHESSLPLHQPPAQWYHQYGTNDSWDKAFFFKQLNLEAHRAGLKVLARKLQDSANLSVAMLKAQQADETDA